MLTAIDRHLPNGGECKTKPTPSTYSPPSFLGVVASWRFDRFCKTNENEPTAIATVGAGDICERIPISCNAPPPFRDYSFVRGLKRK
jgi:hypothetical protein